MWSNAEGVAQLLKKICCGKTFIVNYQLSIVNS